MKPRATCHPEQLQRSITGLCENCYRRNLRAKAHGYATVEDYDAYLAKKKSGRKKVRDHKKTIGMKAYLREHRLKTHYNLTESSYNKLLEVQQWACAICKRKMSAYTTTMWPVDHNHETGEVRGILCRRCNMGLGYFEDNYLLLEAAATYLRYPRDLQTIVSKGKSLADTPIDEFLTKNAKRLPE